MSDEAVRKEFELAALRLNWSQELHSLERMEHGGYLDNYLEMRWQAWQAARSAAIQECADATSEEVEQIAAAADDSVMRERLLTIAQRVYAAALALKER